MSGQHPSFEGYNPGNAGPRFISPGSPPDFDAEGCLGLVGFLIGFTLLALLYCGAFLLHCVRLCLHFLIGPLMRAYEAGRFLGASLCLWLPLIALSLRGHYATTYTSVAFYASVVLSYFAIGWLLPELHLLPWQHERWSERLPIFSYLRTFLTTFKPNEGNVAFPNLFSYTKQLLSLGVTTAILLVIGALLSGLVFPSIHLAELLEPQLGTVVSTFWIETLKESIQSGLDVFTGGASLGRWLAQWTIVVNYALLVLLVPLLKRHYQNKFAEDVVDDLFERYARDGEVDSSKLETRRMLKGDVESNARNRYARYTENVLIERW